MQIWQLKKAVQQLEIFKVELNFIDGYSYIDIHLNEDSRSHYLLTQKNEIRVFSGSETPTTTLFDSGIQTFTVNNLNVADMQRSGKHAELIDAIESVRLKNMKKSQNKTPRSAKRSLKQSKK